ncbi:MAG: UDP-N-acetylmuramoyl-L-alanine--D-glutamate ligase [Hyphococcus sp.]
MASGARVFTWDENKAAREKTAGTEYYAEHPKTWPWNELKAVIVSPGVPLTHPKPHAIVRKAQAENIPVIGDTELFAQAVNALPDTQRPRITMITGSNGKTTTTALIGHVLKENGLDAYVGGNIGEPVLSLPKPTKDAIYVLEMSSFQLDLTHTLRADVAVFLNLSPDHIERHGDVSGYLAAKKRIFNNQSENDVAIVCVDDDYTQGVCTELTSVGGRKVIPVSSQSVLGGGVFALDGQLYYNLDGKTSLAGDLASAKSLRGSHNHQNAAAALAACIQFGLSPALFIRAAEKFENLAHRMEEVGRIGKVLFVNDSKATNASAAERAITAFDDVFWIAGGKAKEGGIASLLGVMDRVRCVYLIGDAAQDFEAQLGGAVRCVQCGDLKKAVERAARDAAASKCPAPVVLLSPACASYDQFKNFLERGDAFRSFVAASSQPNGEAA